VLGGVDAMDFNNATLWLFDKWTEMKESVHRIDAMLKYNSKGAMLKHNSKGAER